MNASNSRYLKVASYSHRLQSNLVVSLPEGTGFHVMSRSDDTGLYNSMTAASGIYIYVLESEVDGAKELPASEGPSLAPVAHKVTEARLV